MAVLDENEKFISLPKNTIINIDSNVSATKTSNQLNNYQQKYTKIESLGSACFSVADIPYIDDQEVEEDCVPSITYIINENEVTPADEKTNAPQAENITAALDEGWSWLVLLGSFFLAVRQSFLNSQMMSIYN